MFQPPIDAIESQYALVFENWCMDALSAKFLRRKSSVDVYRSMWLALGRWASSQGVAPEQLQSAHFRAFITSREGSSGLSERHALRWVRLVERVLKHVSRNGDHDPNELVQGLLAARPDIRFAGAYFRDPLPSSLSTADTCRLMRFLRAQTLLKKDEGGTWQHARNCAAVGLMLGGGLSPGDIRALRLVNIQRPDGWNCRKSLDVFVPADGNGRARMTSVLSWAGRVLEDWLAIRHAEEIPNDMVFPSVRSGKPWGKVAQYNATQAVIASAGLVDARGGSFKLRHTFALRQLHRGHSTAQVAGWLGLADINDMGRYSPRS